MTFVIGDENRRGVAGARTYPLTNAYGIFTGLKQGKRIVLSGNFFMGQLYKNTNEGPAAGLWLLPLGVNVVRADGTALGAVIAFFNVASFSDFFRTLDVGTHGRIAMWNNNGVLIATNSNVTDKVGVFSLEAEERADILLGLPDRTMEFVKPWTEGEITIRSMLANAPLFVSVPLTHVIS